MAKNKLKKIVDTSIQKIYIVTFAYEKILRKFEVLFLLKGGLYRKSLTSNFICAQCFKDKFTSPNIYSTPFQYLIDLSTIFDVSNAGYFTGLFVVTVQTFVPIKSGSPDAAEKLLIVMINPISTSIVKVSRH